MSVREDGGPAFPVIAENGLGHVADGMTLRDWIAGQALQGLIVATVGRTKPLEGEDIMALSKGAYAFADDMLAERSKP